MNEIEKFVTFDILNDNNIINLYTKKPLDINFHVQSQEELENKFLEIENEINYRFRKVILPRQSHTTNVVCIDEDNLNDELVDVDGVVPGIEDTTFFGSSCIKVKDKKDIVITDFSYSNCLKVNDLKVGDYSTTKKETTYNDKEISINLTLALYNYFINNEVFLSNWKDFQYNDTYIKNYIKNGLQKYFKIDQKRNLILNEKTSTEEFEMNIKAPSDASSYSEVKNFKSVYVEDNEDIICKITLENWKNKSYFIELNLNNAER